MLPTTLFRDLPIRKILWLLFISVCIGVMFAYAVIHQKTVFGYLAFFTGLHTLAYFSLKYKIPFYDYAYYCTFSVPRKTIFYRLVKKSVSTFVLPYIISILFLLFVYLGANSFINIVFENRFIDLMTVWLMVSQFYLLFAVSFVLIHFFYGRSKKIASWYEIPPTLFLILLLFGDKLPAIVILESTKWLLPVVLLVVLIAFYLIMQKLFEVCYVKENLQK